MRTKLALGYSDRILKSKTYIRARVIILDILHPCDFRLAVCCGARSALNQLPKLMLYLVLIKGLEPLTHGALIRCSPTELYQLYIHILADVWLLHFLRFLSSNIGKRATSRFSVESQEVNQKSHITFS